MNKRRHLLIMLGLGAIASPGTVFGQQPGKRWRIGYLASSTPPPHLLKAFREGMRERGYVEDVNLSVEYRWTEGSVERLPELAAELARLKVDLMFTWATPATVAAMRATAKIPIVMVGIADPVGSGLVASLPRPGGNVTGVSNLSSDLSGKLVELLVQIVPGASRIAALRNVSNPSSALQLKQTEAGARAMGLHLSLVDVRGPLEFETAFATIAKARAEGVIVFSDPVFLTESKRIADLAMKSRMPTIFARSENVDAGGLVSYGPTLVEQTRHATGYVDRILKGAKPADLPVELPTRLELAVNVRTARALGITIPPSILVRADKVIE